MANQEGVLGLAIKIKGGKIKSTLKVKNINPYEILGLLIFQAINVYENIKKETIKKE